jgi:ABC-type Fe3+/spermidine/putrescine transport system ATPase subunit
MSTPVLEIQGVTKAFDGKPVLQGIDLKVEEHTAVVMNGAIDDETGRLV